MTGLILAVLGAILALAFIGFLRKAKHRGKAVSALTMGSYLRALEDGASVEDAIFMAVHPLRYRSPFNALSDQELRYSSERLALMPDPKLFALLVGDVDRTGDIDMLRSRSRIDRFVEAARSMGGDADTLVPSGAVTLVVDPSLLAIERDIHSSLEQYGHKVATASADFQGYLKAATRVKEAHERLYEYVETDDSTCEVMEEHDATREDLEAIQGALSAGGYACWAYGRLIAAAAIGEPKCLDYLLREYHEKGAIGDQQGQVLLNWFKEAQGRPAGGR